MNILSNLALIDILDHPTFNKLIFAFVAHIVIKRIYFWKSLIISSFFIDYDLRVPFDSMQGLDIGGQVGHAGYGPLDTDMDLDSPHNLNFNSLEPMLPFSPQNAEATQQMAAWYDTDL